MSTGSKVALLFGVGALVGAGFTALANMPPERWCGTNETTHLREVKRCEDTTRCTITQEYVCIVGESYSETYTRVKQ